MPHRSFQRRRQLRPAWWALLLALVGFHATADGTTNGFPARQLSLRDAIGAALLHNRTLQIDRINPEIARENLSASYGVYDPLLLGQARRENITDSGAFDPANPAVDSGFESESSIAGLGFSGLLPSGLIYNLNGNYGHSTGSRNFLNFDSHRTAAGIYLQQPLLKNSWIDLPRLTIRVNKRNLQISEEGVRFTAMNLLNQVQQGYSDLILGWDNVQVQQDLLATRDTFLRNIQRQVELGSMTALDERVAQSQRAKVETDLIAASNIVALAANHLRVLMGVGGADWNEEFLMPTDRLLAAEETFNMHGSWRRALTARPDLIQMVKNVENADLNLKFHRNQLFPALDVVGSYGRRGASSVQAFPPEDPSAPSSDAFDQLARGDAPSDMIGLIFAMPLTRATERANFRAGKELKKQAELLVKQKEELILREVSDAIHTARFSYERLKSARRTTEYAAAALKAEEEKLLGGKSSINFVLLFQADLAAARIEEVRARSEYNKAISQMHFAEGSILERHQIEMEFR